jgi:DNA-binding GntR family transcriptional regulator
MALKYEQIADYLREQITEGRFGPGDSLPSGRDLCEQFAVSRATVIKAMDVLRADGVVVARQGAGFTVVQTPVARPAGRRGTGSRTTGGAGPFRRLGMPAMEEPPASVRAELHLSEAGVERVLDCRPSDGIALAVRLSLPVFAAPELERAMVRVA